MLEHLKPTSADVQSRTWEAQQPVPFAASDADDASYRRSHGGAGSDGNSPFPAFELKGEADNRAPARAGLSGLLGRKQLPQTFRRIVVAVDQSEQARWAVDVAARLAAAVGAELAMVHVVDGMPFGSSASRCACQSGEQQGAEIMRELALRVPRDVRVVKVLRYGVGGREIVNAASEWGADLIVVGTHGRGTVSRFFLLLGSVADHVLRYAECPVMTVSHPPAPAYASDRGRAAAWSDQSHVAAEAIAGTPMCA